MANHNREPRPMPPGAEINLSGSEWKVFRALRLALRTSTCHFGVESSLPNRVAQVVHEEDFPNRFLFVLVATDDESLHKIFQVEANGLEATVSISSGLRHKDYSDRAARALTEMEESGGLTVPNEQELSDLRVTVNDIAQGLLTNQLRNV